jgi:HPt (histidine-containing phosphotransfer) domain-containing protein
MTASAHALNHEIIDDLHAILGEGYGEIVEEQVEQAKEYLGEIAGYLAADDPGHVKIKAHGLKSSAGQIGLQGIHALAKELEMTSLADEAHGACSVEAKALYQTICDELFGAVKALHGYAESIR